jgi:AbrB family looped-hinge helix DNA binding protein
MRAFVVTMDSRGRVTVPAEVRAALGAGPGRRLIFSIRDGEIDVSAEPFTAATLAGSVRALPGARGKDLDTIIQEVKEERANQLAEKMKRNLA